MIKMKCGLLLDLMLENARANADGMGFLQRILIRGEKATLRNVCGIYDISDFSTDVEQIDCGVRTMIECGNLTQEALHLFAQLLSRFPEGSQLVFCHSLGEELCYETLSPYGIKIFEHVNLDAVARRFGEEIAQGDSCYYCLAVKI